MKRALSFFFLFFLLFTPKVFASDNFETSYNVSYKVNENEKTNVTFNIALKNKTSEYYASSYKLDLSFEDIENIRARDRLGELSIELDKEKEGTGISFDFNDRVVGLGNTNQFSISFDTKDVSQKFGRIWEVNIPGIKNQKDFSSFNVRVEVPESLGKEVFVKPNNGYTKSANSILFTKENLGESGVSISYGDYQVYDFDLNYHLYNSNLFPTVSEIAIPSDNNYQTVLIKDILPRPLDVRRDNDGNWIATFRLYPSERKDIRVLGEAKIFLNPRPERISKEQIALYTKPRKYWESTNPEVVKKAKELGSIENIYNYIVDTLSYDETRVKQNQIRAGGANVLKNPSSAVCLEFTDLFITLSRAMGVPARAVEGYANTNNSAQRPLSLLKDVLHSWPEYYDFKKNRWIMVDPTWQNTTKGLDYFNTFDFDHLAFVIKGSSSELPIPAGGYKIPGNENIKDVSVTTTLRFEEKNPSFEALAKFPKSNIAGLPVKGELIIENRGGFMSPSQTVIVTSNSLSPERQNLSIPRIPPFGKHSQKLTFNPTPLLTNETDEIKIMIGNETLVKGILIAPFYLDIKFIAGGFILIVASVAILSLIIRRSRRLSVPGQEGTGTLRREG